MKIKIAVFLCIFSVGCSQNPINSSPGVVNAMHWDSMPSDGWATSPYMSYQMYNYWPFNTNFGGFGPHGPENSIKRISI